MSTHPASSRILAAALALGLLGDMLLRAQGEPALNLFIWTASVGAATIVLHVLAGRGMSAEARLLIGWGVVFAAGMVWRDAPALKLVALGGAALCFALPAYRGGRAWVRDTGIGSYAASFASAGLHAVFGGALVLAELDWSSARANAPRQSKLRSAAGVARGVALAVPLIVVFGALFISADAVFAGLVADVVRVDFDTLASHIALTVVLAAVTAGYLRGSLRGTQLRDGALPTRPSLPITEIGTALGLLALLFLVFVLVQFRYLFGGSDLVHVTPGLTYADYARRGFFELVAVVGLMLPLLLVADWVLRREQARDEMVFRVLAGVQIVLVLAVLASAVQRMRLYQETYGLTEQRFYVTATLILLGAILLWFPATVLRGRRERFALGALVATLLTGAVLHVLNPDAVIARTNMARVQDAGAGNVPFDALYATSLSADAVPVLLEGLPRLPHGERCRIAQRLLDRWPADADRPLRTWNWSDARAHRAIGEQRSDLMQMGCP